MIQHIWTIPCRLSLIARESNCVSLIEILEELTIPSASPVVLDQTLVPEIFDIVTLWSREVETQPVDGAGRVTLVSPAGVGLAKIDYEIDLRELHRVRSISRILGFPAQGPGKYTLRVEKRLGAEGEWEPVAEVPIWVNAESREAPPE